jgi:hypothetical protein
MFNALLGGFYYCLTRADPFMERLDTLIRSGKGGDDVDTEFMSGVEEWLVDLVKYCIRLELLESGKYIKSLNHLFVLDKSHKAMLIHIQSLKTVFENEATDRYVYHYKVEKSRVLLEGKEDWAPALKSFPSIEDEVQSAMECFAIDQNTAAIFHLMRVAELGLRLLSKERRVAIPKKPLEWADWNEILNHLRKKIEEIASKKRGPAKDAALEFYRGALGEFESFKDVYRNNVMHVRKKYDEHQAASVLLHVREFMNRIAGKIDQGATKQIKWGLR